MQSDIADNLAGVVLYLLAVVVGGALIFWGSQPTTGNGAALVIIGVILVAYAGYRFYTTVLQD